MKKTLATLLATTVLSAAIGLPVWNATRAASDVTENAPIATIGEVDQAALPLILADNDDDDDRPGDDDDSDDDDGGDDDDDDDECDDDDDGACIGAANPAPAGTMAPPQNGLFGTGAAPRVQVN